MCPSPFTVLVYRLSHASESLDGGRGERLDAARRTARPRCLLGITLVVRTSSDVSPIGWASADTDSNLKSATLTQLRRACCDWARSRFLFPRPAQSTLQPLRLGFLELGTWDLGLASSRLDEDRGEYRTSGWCIGRPCDDKALPSTSTATPEVSGKYGARNLFSAMHCSGALRGRRLQKITRYSDFKYMRATISATLRFAVQICATLRWLVADYLSMLCRGSCGSCGSCGSSDLSMYDTFYSSGHICEINNAIYNFICLCKYQNSIYICPRRARAYISLYLITQFYMGHTSAVFLVRDRKTAGPCTSIRAIHASALDV